MELCTIHLTVLKHNLKKAHNWKAPGPDKVHNIWYKYFWSGHEKLLELINECIRSPRLFPTFLLKGVTYLIPKSSEFSTDPAQARPITCLCTLYKITTGCLNEIIYSHVNSEHILCEEQKGCGKNAKGCKEQLTVDQVILEQAVTGSRNLFVAYVDYKKAFDSVPHDWMIEVLKQYNIHPNIIAFLSTTMENWRTRLEVRLYEQCVVSREISINRGIFQGDCLSPLWFCLALNPLSQILNTTGYGFKIKCENQVLCSINHLSYMDDIKLFASTKEHLNKLIQIVNVFTKDIRMEFGLSKCRTISIIRGKLSRPDQEMQNDNIFEELDEGNFYKYLGIQQSFRINQKIVKKFISNETIGRVHKITKSKLKGKFLIKAINTYAIPVMTYSFGVIKWTETELLELQRKIRTTLTKYQCHHPKSCLERMVLPRKIGGRGLLDIHLLHNRQINSLRNYFHNKASRSRLISAICRADENLTPLKLAESDLTDNSRQIDQKIADWSIKAIHGKFFAALNSNQIDISWSNKWLTMNTLFAESEGFMIAIQDEVIPTRNYLKYVMKSANSPEDVCRMCGCKNENISHILSSCTSLASSEYLHRHNNVAKILYIELLKKFGIKTVQDRYYLLNPEPVVENEQVRIYFDRTLYTPSTIEHNRPDIAVVDKLANKALLIDIAVPLPHNLETTYRSKIIKYLELAEELKAQWNLIDIEVIPIILSSNGLIPKKLVKNIEMLKIPMKTISRMQKAVLIDTCHIVRKFLNC